MARKRRDDMYEWTDPNTEEVHRCPVAFMRVVEHLSDRKQYMDGLLRRLGMELTDVNRRHLRQAIMILRLKGVLIVATRSAKNGGYSLATPKDVEEVEAFVSTQEKLGRAMLANAADFRKKFNEMLRDNEDPQGNLFPLR
jgi:hypothetical protein